MATPNFHDQIPDYCAGYLSQAEREAFEQALRQDASLKASVTIWQEMEQVLAPAPEDQLVANLSRLRAESGAAPPTKPRPWWLGILLLLLIGASSWYFWPENEAPAPVIESVKPPKKMERLDTPVDTLEVASEDSLATEPVAPPTTPDPPFRRVVPPPEEMEDAPQPPVFAANYDPNPMIETEMTEQLRGGEVTLALTAPAVEAIPLAANGTIPLVFSGSITTGLTQDELTIRLLLLSNAIADYQQSNYLVTLPATLSPADNGFTFVISGTAAVKPGLYYYFLEWEEEETYLKVGRIRVE